MNKIIEISSYIGEIVIRIVWNLAHSASFIIVSVAILVTTVFLWIGEAANKANTQEVTTKVESHKAECLSGVYNSCLLLYTNKDTLIVNRRETNAIDPIQRSYYKSLATKLLERQDSNR